MQGTEELKRRRHILRRAFVALAIIFSLSGVMYLGIAIDSDPVLITGFCSICLSVIWFLGYLRGGVRSGLHWLLVGLAFVLVSTLSTIAAFF